ncbi:hypothetical protein CVT25_007741 [Psilocybe cyanescens]|uniref:Rhodopsin domain-containing protein n=1 Tax=Psilocybe cyanescens TaxID=93625 RepID=A0A409XHW1_PSICY|nr:hypothetical protein CVT25_007741 [Psilocybe cyanescens]
MDESTLKPLTTSLFLPHKSYLGWKIVITIFHLFATTSTIYRLVHRYRIRRLWRDDYILFVALALDISHWPIYWARSPSVEGSSKSFIKTQQILNSYWLTIVPWFLILACTRISLALSFARIFPPRHPARRWSFTLVFFFILNFTGTVLATTLTCKAASGLLVASEMSECIRVSNGVPLKNIIVFVADASSDLSLILTPLYFFWGIKLPAQERRLILTFFCGSTLTLLSAVMYAVIANSQSVASLKKDWSLVNLGLGAIETSMSFVGCNSVVISTCFYQALRRFRGQERPELESTLETPRVPPSRECTCVISEHLTAVSLTDISGNSYNYGGDSHADSRPESQSDSAVTSQNSQSRQSFSGSEYSSSQYTTTQNSNSQDSNSQYSSSSSHSGSRSYHSQSTDAPSSFQRSFSTSGSHVSSNQSAP